MKNMLFKDLLIFIFATTLAIFFIKRLIYISHKKHLFDEPLEARKIHKSKTPNLGGIAILGSMVLTGCLFFSISSFVNFNYIFFSILILFLTGVTDDLIGVQPTKKLFIQFLSSFILVFFGGFRFTSFYGLFGFGDMPYVLSIGLSIFFITFVINAFNLIDGINCLAGSIGLLASVCFAFYFIKLNDTAFASVSIAMCGCLAGFLWFNKTPAKIFMGDTGSLFIGLMISLFSIHFLELSKSHADNNFFSLSPLTFVAALLVIPVYDTVRIFMLRIANAKSPFTADRNHIHHRLIDLGLSHLQATGILMFINIIILSFVFLFHNSKPEYFLVTVLILIMVFNSVLSVLASKRKVSKRLMERENIEPHIRIIVNKKNAVGA